MTLWEVLIILIIVAVLAAIAVPNFLESSRPSKVTTAKNRLRDVSKALEAYRDDNGAFPGLRPLREFYTDPTKLDRAGGGALFGIDSGGPGHRGLTTPVAYAASLLSDPFAPEEAAPFAYYTDGEKWILISPGPDGDYDINPKRDCDFSLSQPTTHILLMMYDPTNGTKHSDGDIVRPAW